MAQKSPEVKETDSPLFKLFSGIGIFLIILGAIYFFKYAIDNNWIGPVGQIGIGAVVSLAFVVLGYWLFLQDYEKYSQVIISLGFALLFFTILSTYFYDVYRNALNMSLTLNTILLTCSMLGALVLGLYMDKKMVVYGSLSMSYLAAFLSGSDGHQFNILFFVLVANFVSLYVLSQKKWDYGVISVIVTFVGFSSWFFGRLASNEIAHENFIALGILIVYFAQFTWYAFIAANSDLKTTAVTITIINAIGTALFGIKLFGEFFPDYKGVFVFLCALVALYLGVKAQTKKLDYLSDMHYLMSILLTFIAIAVQFDHLVETLLFALVSVGLAVAGVKIESKKLFSWGYISFILVFIRAIADLIAATNSVDRLITMGAVIGGLIAIQQLARLYYKEDTESDPLYTLYSLGGFLLLAIWVPIEIFASNIPGDSKSMMLSIIWALLGIATIAYGITFQRKMLNWCGVTLFGIVVLKILLNDIWTLENIFRVIALVGVGILSLVGAFFFVKNKESIKKYL